VRSGVGLDDADADGDDAVGAGGLAAIRRLFGSATGPSGLACAGSAPCLGR